MIYLLNLSISDGLVGLVELLLKLLYYIGQVKPELFKNSTYWFVYRLLVFVFLRISLLMSVLNLTAITIDRIYCVRRPIQYRQRSRKTTVCICVILWIISTTFLTTIWFVLDEFGSKATIWKMELLVFPVVTLPASIILLSSYTYIWMLVRKQNKTFSKQRTRQVADGISIVSCDSPNQSIERRKKQEKQLLTLAFTIVFVFLICWLPLSIHSLLKFNQVITVLPIENVLFAIAISNSFLDPLIYFHFIRKTVKKTIRNKIPWKRFFNSTESPNTPTPLRQRREISLPIPRSSSANTLVSQCSTSM